MKSDITIIPTPNRPISISIEDKEVTGQNISNVDIKPCTLYTHSESENYYANQYLKQKNNRPGIINGDISEVDELFHRKHRDEAELIFRNRKQVQKIFHHNIIIRTTIFYTKIEAHR